MSRGCMDREGGEGVADGSHRGCCCCCCGGCYMDCVLKVCDVTTMMTTMLVVDGKCCEGKSTATHWTKG